ncbi:WYL domain-containing transcriptional regulator [Pelistega sp. NLN82]|uniref:WYL domain-containing transcriptional regulator n=1 Tax=Pelistega ratti TaxID=2652177 RepID=A0A6L9Y3M3_9BURK|nr:WYL domain-containing transcriptional regulator [Pelistega ratti]NEN75019.1 WYL domain-containing transcriptional regulator [Pelistega ratti]
MSTKHEKLAFRLVCILERLNLGQRLNVQELADEFKTDKRTIQRDLNERLGFLDWHEKGTYYSLNKMRLGHLDKKDIEQFARFCSIQDLLPEIDRKFYQQQLIQSVQVKGLAYEDIKHKLDDFNLINQAIETRHLIEFNYRKVGQKEGKYYTLEPYILLNRNGIWYVIGIDREENKQKTFCFTQMVAISCLATTFEHNPELLKTIQENDSIYHGNQLSEVLIKINANVAPYFLRRDLLPNQKIVDKMESGELLLKCRDVNEMEIVPIVQYWIPHATIVSPVELQQKMEQKLREYLNR